MGKVVSVDSAGNLITDIQADQLVDVPRDERVTIQCEGHKTCGIFPLEHGQPELTFCAVLGTDGSLLLMMVGESAQAFLGISPGASVTLHWTA